MSISAVTTGRAICPGRDTRVYRLVVTRFDEAARRHGPLPDVGRLWLLEELALRLAGVLAFCPAEPRRELIGWWVYSRMTWRRAHPADVRAVLEQMVASDWEARAAALLAAGETRRAMAMRRMLRAMLRYASNGSALTAIRGVLSVESRALTNRRTHIESINALGGTA